MSQDVMKMYGKGASLLMKMGYTPGKGLGENGRGIVEPIMPTILKRGEGIKVEEKKKMMSRIVNEWSDSSDDNDDDDDDIPMADKDFQPLDFNKSGIFKSEYDIPELFEIVRELGQQGIDIPEHILKKAEISKSDDDIELRRKMLNLLTLLKTNQPKLKYLDFEKKQLNEARGQYQKNIDVLDKAIKLIEGKYPIDINNILAIPGLKNIDQGLLNDIIGLIASRIQETWNEKVARCHFEDIVELGELLDEAVMNLKIQELTCTELIEIKHFDSKLGGKETKLVFSTLGAVIMQPLITKLCTFYNEWDVKSVNLGIGVFEEIKDSAILSDVFLDAIIVKSIILPKMYNSFQDFDHNEDFKWLVGWLEIFPTHFDEVVEKIVQTSCHWLKHSDFGMQINHLKALPVFYWLDLAQNPRLHELVRRSLFYYCMATFCYYFKDVSNDAWVLLDANHISALQQFMQYVREFNLYEYEDIIYDKILVPYWIGYLQLYQEGNDFEEFLKQFIEVFSCAGLLNDYNVLTTVHEGVSECCEHLNFVMKKDLVRKPSKTFMDLNCLNKMKINDWKELLDKPHRKHSTPKFNSVKKLKSIKDIVFQKCEERGVPIIPARIEDGKQMYVIEKHGIKHEIFFDQKVIFANYNGMKEEPIGLNELDELLISTT